MSTPACAECGGDHPTGLCATRISSNAVPAAPVAGRVALAVDAHLGTYRLTRLLGRGSSSEVFLGENEVTQVVTAVKVLRPELHGDKEMVRRFESEARTTDLVRHPHVVEINDIGLANHWQHYILLEYLDGPTLTTLLERKLDPALATRIVLQLCAALGAAHARGVVHRDLKPANVFVLQRDGQPHVKLVDFGMARREKLNQGEDRTRIGTVVGTAAFMSPEQTLGLEADGRSDVYSLGVMMFRMATGRLPFEAQSAVDAMLAHAEQAPPAPRSLDPKILPEYEQVILRCLAKAPNDRWQTMADLGRAVAAAAGGSGPKPRSRGATATVHFGAPATQPAQAVPPPLASPRARIETDPSLLATPAEGNLAVRRDPRVRTSFGVRVFIDSGALVGEALVADISMGGAFVRSLLELPLFTRVRIVGTSSAGPLDIAAEVVRIELHDPSSRGFGVRFDEPTGEQRRVLEALTRPRDEKGSDGSPDAEARLRVFESRVGGDAYAMIGVPKDASTRRIRDVCARLSEELDPKHYPGLSLSQGRRLVAVTRRLTDAEEELIDPLRRVLTDAIGGNVLGVLRCITEGLELERLDALRVEFLKVRPDAEELARPALVAAARAERGGDLSAALASLADALCHDPLNLKLHRRAVDLRGRSRTAQTLPGVPAADLP